MLVAIVHNAVADDAPPDERDVLVQAAAVADAVRSLGHEPVAVPVTLDLEAFRRRIEELRPAAVFNLVEALAGTDRLSPTVPLLLETLGIPYTGNDAEALYLTNSKLFSKWRLGPTTPSAFFPDTTGTLSLEAPNARDELFPNRYLVKAVHEHASFGMDDASVIDAASHEDLAKAVADRRARFGKPFFAEPYIDGREFNLTVLDRGDGSPEVLPPAEIRFDTFPAGKPKIVGYAAKWDDAAFEYHATPRRFDFPPEDAKLLDDLAKLATKAWHWLGLRGYARVDFRVDEAGRPWVIEANANPCLSPDAGFAAALANARIPFPEAVRRILAAALAGKT